MSDAPDTHGATAARYFIDESGLRALTAELLAAGTEVVAPVATDVCQSPSAIASSACLLPGVAPVDIDYKLLGDAAELDLSAACRSSRSSSSSCPSTRPCAAGISAASSPRSRKCLPVSLLAWSWRRSPATPPPWPWSTKS